ncbi:MAG: heme biosynthesis HemY N-terminal domain-containing protein [Hyphomicrobium sp.]|jgi:HemY protein
MIRLVLFLLGVLAIATGLSWLADQPGTLKITFQDYEIETSVFRAVVILTAVLGLVLVSWSIVRQLWSSPAAVSHFLTRRRQRRGLDALSSGMIAIGAGDRGMATRYAMQARKSLPNEPLTHLLRAQAAQLSGDKATARRIFEAMLASPDTEQLGLRGLYLEAAREEETEVQRQFAERALGLNPKLAWPVEALFNLQCKAGDWSGALETLATARRHGHIEKPLADRRRAVLLTAQAQALEDDNPDKALTLALEAHGLAPTLVPAAAIAGRQLAARGNTPRAAKVIQRTWAKAPHPELAAVYAYARVGDSPRDRLDRVKQLSTLAPQSVESWIAVALAAIEAREYDEARKALAPYTETGLTRRIATLLARIEAEESGDKGRAREWLARAAIAPRDAAWTADGIVSDRWAAISPVTGALDAFQWRVPVEEAEPGGQAAVLGGAGLGDLMAPDEPGTTIVGVPVESESPHVIEASAAVAEGAALNSATRPPTRPATKDTGSLKAEAGPDVRGGDGHAVKTAIYKAPHAPDDPGPLDDTPLDSTAPRRVPG